MSRFQKSVIWRRLMSTWGNCWKGEEFHQDAKKVNATKGVRFLRWSACKCMANAAYQSTAPSVTFVISPCPVSETAAEHWAGQISSLGRYMARHGRARLESRVETWPSIPRDLRHDVEPQCDIRARGWPPFRAETETTRTPNSIIRLWENSEHGVAQPMLLFGTRYIQPRLR
ncbi:uncharacterized protein BCR38DRAFT_91585 [Pseudomassariella vexata]|uniref:Uncharacterized protein n=1 Tax=Pseudomassariella vexata TaxID=1141098 RepID=A0A1Y2EDU2_9PEZI|nr:uncharacterized protein BCR38DRAFT_91585 [Pseudomassariella vexata]ORY69742.1 hypothetical protein BCR38DRAFT_91585 [Pseudomassariella vexata]